MNVHFPQKFLPFHSVDKYTRYPTLLVYSSITSVLQQSSPPRHCSYDWLALLTDKQHLFVRICPNICALSCSIEPLSSLSFSSIVSAMNFRFFQTRCIFQHSKQSPTPPAPTALFSSHFSTWENLTTSPKKLIFSNTGRKFMYQPT